MSWRRKICPPASIPQAEQGCGDVAEFGQLGIAAIGWGVTRLGIAIAVAIVVVDEGVDVALRARQAEEAAQPRDAGHGPWRRHA